MRLHLFAAAALAASLAAFAPATAPASGPSSGAAAPDPFQWLEQINSPRALAWVARQNAITRKVLEGDPRYEVFRKEALAIFTAEDRIPTPRLRAGEVDNLWQDKTHHHGVWRRTSLQSFASARPDWETVLDLDALSKAEGADWYSKGERCLQPQERLCLVRLSNGGKDAVSIREFDADQRAFVPGGFSLPEGKQNVDWLDKDTLIVARDWGPGTTTRSGYPFIVKILKRGQPLDQAREIFHGSPSDVQVGASVLRDPDGKVRAVLIDEGVGFFQRKVFLLEHDKPVELPMAPKAELRAFVEGQLVFRLAQDWNAF